MIRVYIDPHSYMYLHNTLFQEKAENYKDDVLAFWSYLKKHCFEKGISLHTIDTWNESVASGEDVYVSFEHKNFLKRIYWYSKDNRYPITVPFEKFKNKVLFQFESQFIMPEVYVNIEDLFAIYNTVFFACKVNYPKVRYFHYAQAHNAVLTEYWQDPNRGFLTMINSNTKPRDFKKFFFTVFSSGRLPRRDHKELISERIKAVEFFSKTSEIDLYGSDWEKLPALENAYKGRAESKYAALSNYTFSICYENCVFLGYITEKIFDCFFTGTIPIYLGAPDIAEYVPKNCFIDMREFKSYEDLRIFLKSLSKEQIQEYKENGRKFLESEQYKPFTKEYFADVFIQAIQDKVT